MKFTLKNVLNGPDGIHINGERFERVTKTDSTMIGNDVYDI